MYFFIRLTAVIFMILGILLMLAALIVGVISIVALFSEPLTFGPRIPGIGPMLFATGGGLFVAIGILLQGLFFTAIGQLLLLFIDMANNTQATANLLRHYLARVDATRVEAARPGPAPAEPIRPVTPDISG